MPFYDEMRDMVSEMLLPDAQGGFGQGVIVLTRTPAPTVNPDASWEDPTPGAPQVYPLNGAVSGVREEYIDGKTITASDEMVTAAVFGAQPEAGDVLTVDGRVRTILKIKALPAAGVTCAWHIIIKG